MAEEEAQTEVSQKKKTPLLIGLIAGLVVAAGSGVAVWKFVLQGSPEAHAEKPHQETIAKPESLMVHLDPFIVNLFDEQGIRYLKLSLDVEFEGCTEEEVDKSVPKVRDSLIILLSSKKYDEIGSIEGKIRLREEILYRLNRIMGEGKAKDVYFTDFVVQ